jgi:hypothetical protein
MSDKPDTEHVQRLMIRRDILGDVYTKARAEYEQASREANEAFQNLMHHEDTRCHGLIRSGWNPLYCQLDHGHDGEHWHR